MPLFECLLYLFLFVLGIQCIYYVCIFGRFAAVKPIKKTSINSHPVSVIICARNEAENINDNLPHIISQSYPEFEIVLVNDNSTDDTLNVMQAFKSQNNTIRIVDIQTPKAVSGNKKYALTEGIKASKFETLLFTDADCKPLSPHWISRMSKGFDNQNTIVIGYSPYQKIRGSFLNLMIRFETFMTAVQYFSYALIGQPYMAVGRNLAYKKDQFTQANGFMNHMEIQSGDDDLFINQVATMINTTICISKDSFTASIPKKTFKSWILQKRRHISTASYYKSKHKILLITFYCSQFLFWVLGLLLLFSTNQWELIAGLMILRFIIQYVILYFSATKLNEKDLVIFIPCLELFLIIFQFFIFIKNLSSKPQHWN